MMYGIENMARKRDMNPESMNILLILMVASHGVIENGPGMLMEFRMKVRRTKISGTSYRARTS
jgi:hypothetical protein